MSEEELTFETNSEAADLLAFILFIPWSRAYHSTLVQGEEISLDEDAPDVAVDSEVVDAVVEALMLLSASRRRSRRSI
jgi:hypothetical protein